MAQRIDPDDARDGDDDSELQAEIMRADHAFVEPGRLRVTGRVGTITP